MGGGSAPLPVPAGASAFGRASPPQGLCGSGRLECGQHPRCSPPTDARRRTEAAFLRRGLAPRARCSLQELPCFPLGGSAPAANRKPPRFRVARPQVCPRGPATPWGARRGGKDEGNVLPFALAPSTLPTHGCSRNKSSCCRAPGTPDLSSPQGAGRFSFLPGRFNQQSSLVPPIQGCRRCLTSAFRLRPRCGVGRGRRRSQLSSRRSLRDRRDVSTRSSRRRRPRTPPPSPPRATVRCPGLRLPSSSSSPSLQRRAGSSHSLALISHV